MMLLIVLSLPLVAALLCLALNRRVPTRFLGIGAAVAQLATAGLLFILAPDEPNLGLVLLASFAYAIALLGVALALGNTLRGFGGLVATLLLLSTSVYMALLLSTEWLALALSIAVLISFAALRAARVSSPPDQMPLALIGGLLAVLLFSVLPLVTAGQLSSGPAVLLAITSLVLLAGLPPLHAMIVDYSEAPATLAAPLLACGAALIGGIGFIRYQAQLLVPSAAVPFVVLFSGLAVLFCAAAALGERRLRRCMAWQYSAQMALLPALLTLPPTVRGTALPALLFGATFALLTSLLAIASLERRVGSDDMTKITLREPHPLLGIAILVAAASACGLPGVWGFWPRFWLIEAVSLSAPWFAPLFIVSSLLLGISFVAPLLLVLRPNNVPSSAETVPAGPSAAVTLLPVLAAVPLLVFGVAPTLSFWFLATASELVEQVTAVPLIQPIGVGAAGLLVLLPLILARSTPRQVLVDPELAPEGMPGPQALGHALRSLAIVGDPTRLLAQFWSLFVRGADLLRQGLGLLEQRYYLAGLVIGLVVVILLIV
jgi:hypothetical protein